MGSAGAVHPGKRTRESKVYVLGGGGGKKTRASSKEGDEEQGEEHDRGKEIELGINLLEQSQQNEAVPIHNSGDPCPHQEVFISD